MVRLIKIYKKIDSFDKAPLFLVHGVQTAAITHLLISTSMQPEIRNKSTGRFRVCFGALEAMGSRWPRSRRAITALREMAYRWGVVNALPMRYSTPLALAQNAGHSYEHVQPSSTNSSRAQNKDTAVHTTEDWDFVDPTDLTQYNIEDFNLPSASNW